MWDVNLIVIIIDIKERVRMKILVTGAAGFIGSALSCFLVKSGHEVLGVDNFSNYYDVSLKDERIARLLRPQGVKVVELDLGNRQKTTSLMSQVHPDVVVHLAAQPGVRLAIADYHKYVESNLLAFANVLTATVELEVPHFLYASSSSVYGSNSKLPYSEKELRMSPDSFYGGTKLANEILAKSLVNGSKTNARGLRLFTVYGPWGRPDMAYFRIINSTLNDSKFTLFGDGKIKRDFSFIDDVVLLTSKLIDELTTNKAGFADVVNLGGGTPYSINDLIANVGEITNKTISFKMIEASLNDSKITESDPTYARNLIGEMDRTPLVEGLNSTIAWAMDGQIQHRLSGWVDSTK